MFNTHKCTEHIVLYETMKKYFLYCITILLLFSCFNPFTTGNTPYLNMLNLLLFIQYRGNMPSIISSDSEVNASELLENIEEMFRHQQIL